MTGESVHTRTAPMASLGETGRPPATPESNEPRATEDEILPLTGIRGVLAWWVVLFHLSALFDQLFPGLQPISWFWKSGDAAVDVFFMLSGLVIRIAYDRPGRSFGPRSYFRFLWARLARLYPVHITQQMAWAVAVVCAAKFAGDPAAPNQLVFGDLLKNFLLVHAWGAPLRMSWNYPAWSVSLEWLAYLLTPLVFAAVNRLRSSGQVLAALMVVWGTLLLYQQSAFEHFFRICCGYTAGALLASPSLRLRVPARLENAPVLLVATLIGSVTLLRRFESPYFYAFPLAGVVILVLASPVNNGKVLSGPWCLLMGRASYSLYMTHALAITAMHQVAHPSQFASSSLGMRVTLLGAYLVVIACAGIGSYSLIEEPARKLMRGWLGTRLPNRLDS